MENLSVAVRRELLKNTRQVIVKAGTRLLASQEAIAGLMSGIEEIRRRGCRVLLVTSGAVGMGMRALGLARRRRSGSAG